MSSASGPLRAMLHPARAPGPCHTSEVALAPQPAPVLCFCSDGRERLGTPQLAPLGVLSLRESSPRPDPGVAEQTGLSVYSRRIWSHRFSQQIFPYALKQSGVCESCVTKRGKYMGGNDNLFVSRQGQGSADLWSDPQEPFFCCFFTTQLLVEKNTPNVECNTQPF